MARHGLEHDAMLPKLRTAIDACSRSVLVGLGFAVAWLAINLGSAAVNWWEPLRETPYLGLLGDLLHLQDALAQAAESAGVFHISRVLTDVGIKVPSFESMLRFILLQCLAVWVIASLVYCLVLTSEPAKKEPSSAPKKVSRQA